MSTASRPPETLAPEFVSAESGFSVCQRRITIAPHTLCTLLNVSAVSRQHTHRRTALIFLALSPYSSSSHHLSDQSLSFFTSLFSVFHFHSLEWFSHFESLIDWLTDLHQCRFFGFYLPLSFVTVIVCRSGHLH